MINFSFNGNVLFSHHFSGKFDAPSEEWIHLTRDLIDFELMVVTEGTLYIADHENEYVVNEGEYLFMTPTVYQHGYKAGSCSFYWLHFHCPTGYEVVESEDVTFNNSMIYVPKQGKLSSLERVIMLFNEMQDYYMRYNHFAINDSFATAIVAEIGCQSILYKDISQSQKNSHLIKSISDYVRLHCSEKLTVVGIADYFSYSPRYLSSIFKTHTGVSLKQFILQTKMESAKSELIKTNHSIEQIAYNLGFDDAHNFSHAFKKIIKITPTDYRRNFSEQLV